MEEEEGFSVLVVVVRGDERCEELIYMCRSSVVASSPVSSVLVLLLLVLSQVFFVVDTFFSLSRVL